MQRWVGKVYRMQALKVDKVHCMQAVKVDKVYRMQAGSKGACRQREICREKRAYTNSVIRQVPLES